MMSTILFECDATEYACIPPEDNDINSFSINEKSLVISFCVEGNVLLQSEISIEDARRLAKLILL